MIHCRRSWRGVAGVRLCVVILPGNSENPATSVHPCPGIDETVDHRVEPFWEGLVLTEELRGLADDGQFALQFANPPARGA